MLNVALGTVKHALVEHHLIWDQISVIEQAKSVDIQRIKEAFCIMMAEKGRLLNMDQVQPSLPVGNHFYSKECITPHDDICH